MIPATYLAVDYGAIQHNTQQVLGRTRSGCSLMAMVGADACGHGLEATARACLAGGAAALGVAGADEGVRLRDEGIGVPVLVFTPLVGDDVSVAVEHNLMLTVIGPEHLQEAADAAADLQMVADIQIMLEGALPADASAGTLPELIGLCARTPQVRLRGIYARLEPELLTSSRGSLMDTLRPGSEMRLLEGAVKAIAEQELGRPVPVHVADSAALLLDEAFHVDMVRSGRLLYGDMPAGVSAESLVLKRTCEFRSRIVDIIEIEPRTRMAGFVAQRRTKVGAVPVGLWHGLGMEALPEEMTLRRWLGRYAQGPRQLVVADRKVNILGRVSLHRCHVDLTDLPGSRLGAPVVIPLPAWQVSPAVPRVPISLPEVQSA